MTNASDFQQIFGLNLLLLCRTTPLFWSEERQPLTWQPQSWSIGVNLAGTPAEVN